MSPVDAATPGPSRIVAYQGAEGSYSSQSAARHFSRAGLAVELVGYPTFRAAMEAVSSGFAEYGVLPIENTTAGSINETYDLLARHDVRQIGEEVLRIEHCLLALQQVPVERIRRIVSQPQALAQCTDFLDSLPHCEAVAFTDTAMACQKVAQDGDSSQAAIASERAGTLWGLHVICRDIANQKENYTRFAVIARSPATYALDIPCKTSLIFATRHEKGALVACLEVLARHDLNLSKLESRPRPRAPWEYLFYVDFDGNVASLEVQDALRELETRTNYLKVLGSYPRAS